MVTVTVTVSTGFSVDFPADCPHFVPRTFHRTKENCGIFIIVFVDSMYLFFKINIFRYVKIQAKKWSKSEVFSVFFQTRLRKNFGLSTDCP